MGHAIDDRLAAASSILVATPSIGTSRAGCSTVLAEAAPASVLFVTYTRAGDECLAAWAETGDTADTLGVIAVGDTGLAPDRADVEVREVSSAGDLTGLGIEIGQILGTWPAPVAICFDSLTAMLQYVDFETAYEFLHTITGQVYAADARAHFHVDPEAHDEQQLAALSTLVDASMTLDGDEWVVRSRGLLA